MAESRENRPDKRVLCLGNDILADDAFGIVAAKELRACLPSTVDIAVSMEAGFYLLDYLLDVSLVVVVDTIQTNGAEPGTIHIFEDGKMQVTGGGSPHYIGLFESLALGEELGLPITERLVILAVEASDFLTVGGPMHPDVRSALPEVVRLVTDLVS